MEELTTDHVSVLCQAAINLCRGQAHLGSARDAPRFLSLKKKELLAKVVHIMG